MKSDKHRYQPIVGYEVMHGMTITTWFFIESHRDLFNLQNSYDTPCPIETFRSKIIVLKLKHDTRLIT